MSEAQSTAVTGFIFDIQKFCIHDGPGIRTTVFVKGCPLRCLWCHNPESIDPGRNLSFDPRKCIGCGYCFRVCPRDAHAMDGEQHVVRREECALCGSCTAECYAGALEMAGREVTVEEALAEVMRDKPFYDTSGGGMTLSGGEPLQQIEFTEALLRAAKAEGLHCCVETCGHAPFSRVERLLPYVDLWLYDVKETDSDRHAELTGVPNDRILGNLRELGACGAAVRLRLPIIPGCNDRPDHFRAVAALAAELGGLERVEVLPYHRLGESKRERFGLGDQTLTSQPPEEEEIAGWLAQLRELGVPAVDGRTGE